MSKRLLIHDMQETQIDELKKYLSEDVTVFAASPAVKHCIGCFNCWVKTPGKCIIADRCDRIPMLLAESSEMIIVSRLRYGGYSPDIKAVLDRSIGYIMPYFRIIDNEMHHTMRYQNPFLFTVYFYGESISEREKQIAKQLVEANRINLGAGSCRVIFESTINQVKEVIA